MVALGSGGVRIEDVRWPPLLALDAVAVESQLAGLLRGRADGLVVERLRVTIEGEEQLASLRAALGRGGGGDTGRLAAVPDRIAVLDARASVRVGALRAELRLDTDLVRKDGEGPWRGGLEAELRADPVHVTTRLSASAGAARIGGEGPFEVGIDGSLRPFGLEDVRIDGLRGQGQLALVAEDGVPGAWLELDATPLTGRFFGVDVRGAVPALDVRLEPGEEEPLVIEARDGSLRRRDEPGRLEELSLDGSVSAEGFTLRGSGRILDAAAGEATLPPTVARGSLTRRGGEDRLALALEIEGVAEPVELEGARARGADGLTFTVRPFDLGPHGLGRFALASGLLPGVETLSGQAEILRGRVTPATGDLAFDLVLRDGGAGTAAGRAHGIHGTVAVTGPAPWRTDGPQTLAVASVQAGLPFEDGRLAFEIEADGRLRVDALDLHVAGGTARTEDPFHLDPGDTRVVFAVEGLDLAALLAEIAIEGLGGEGTLRGRLPFEWNGERARLRGGLLEATGPGVLSYVAGVPLAPEATGGHDLGVLTDVLEDFRYDVLRIEADGDLLGTVQLVLHTEGHNPSFQDGRPIDFTLNLEAPFADLLGSTRWVTQPPMDVEQLLERLPPTPGAPPSRGGDG